MKKTIAVDTGNYDIKYVLGDGKQGFFRHALTPLNDEKWRRATAQGISSGFFLVNGEAYAVGDSALRMSVAPRRKGASRYEAGYIGVLAVVAIYSALRGKSADVDALVSYPPADYGYMHDLQKAVSGRWEVSGEYGTARFNVDAICAFDEPMGGMAHFGLKGDGTIDGRVNLDESVLVIDVGGYTIDALPVDAGFLPDYTASGSTRTGTIDLLQSFEQAMRHTYRDKFKNAGVLDVRRVESALVTGKYKFGSKALDVSDEAESALTSIGNDVMDIIAGAGGIANYDRLLMTGGGSVLLHPMLKASLPDITVQLVNKDRDLLRFANADGYLRLHKLLVKTGQL